MLLVEEDFLRDTYQAAAHAIQTKSDSVPDLASLAAKVSVYYVQCTRTAASQRIVQLGNPGIY